MKTLYKKLFTTVAIASLTSTALAQDIRSDDTLPPLSLTLGNVTVSGMSSGGYMATQFHVAHSNWVKGAGILAAGRFDPVPNSTPKISSEPCPSYCGNPGDYVNM